MGIMLTPTQVKRKALALEASKAIQRAMRLKLSRYITLLHRAEVGLEDSMEWDFTISSLTEDEYNFLHKFSTLLATYEGYLVDVGQAAIDFTFTYPESIQVLEASIKVLNISHANCHNPIFSPADNPECLGILDTVPSILRPMFSQVPVILMSCIAEGSKAGRMTMMTMRDSFGEWLIATTEKARDVLAYANRALLLRGLGDK